MTAYSLLARLRQHGVWLYRKDKDAKNLGMSNSSEIPAAMMDEVRAAKPKLLAALAAERMATDPRAPSPVEPNCTERRRQAEVRAAWEADCAAWPETSLFRDSELWGRLLRLAYERDGDDSRGLFMALHGMRCLGARLRWQEGASGRFLALYRGAEMEASEYAEARQRYLVPHAEAIRELFAQIAAEYARWLAQQPRTNNGE